ncbi:MAG: NUDIX hydrolase [Candidatus Altimarinota bacterium]
MPLKELSRTSIASGKHLELLQIELEGGKIYDAVARVGNKNAVAGLVRHTQNQTYIFIEQYRYPLQAKVLELVAGIIDKPEKTIIDIMKEEIREETGYSQIVNIEFISQTSASAGSLSETTTLYDIEISGPKGIQNLSEMEDITVLEIPYKDFEAFYTSKKREGVIFDPKVCMAVYDTLKKVKPFLR